MKGEKNPPPHIMSFSLSVLYLYSALKNNKNKQTLFTEKSKEGNVTVLGSLEKLILLGQEEY